MKLWKFSMYADLAFALLVGASVVCLYVVSTLLIVAGHYIAGGIIGVGVTLLLALYVDIYA